MLCSFVVSTGLIILSNPHQQKRRQPLHYYHILPLQYDMTVGFIL